MGYFDSVKAARDAPPPITGSVVVELRPRADDTPYGLSALRSEAAIVATAPAGQRNDTLNRAWYNMGRVIAGGNLTAATARATLTDAGLQAGLDENEIRLVLRDDSTSGVAKGSSKPRIPQPLAPVPEVTVLEDIDETTEAEFWGSREILTHLHTFARARCVAPWAVLGNAMTRIVAATHPSIALPPIVGGYASLNLFVGVVGRSGAGKGAAESVAREAIDVGPIAVRNTGSGEGAVHAYMKRTKDGLEQHTTSVLFSIPEIDSLGAVGARQGATLMPLLRSGWSGEQLGFQYADPAKNLLVPAHQYRMCLVAGIQPGRAGTLLDDEDGGTPQRFLWLPATDPDAPEQMPAAPKPIEIRDMKPIMVTPGGLFGMDVCDAARDLIVSERRKAVRGEGAALDGHALLTRLKTAAALALLERRRNVSDEDWELSGVIARKSDATRSTVIAHRQAELRKGAESRALAEAERQTIVDETVAEKNVARVARRLHGRIKSDPVTWSDARRILASRDRKYFEDAIEHLRKAGLVEIREASHGAEIVSREQS